MNRFHSLHRRKPKSLIFIAASLWCWNFTPAWLLTICEVLIRQRPALGLHITAVITVYLLAYGLSYILDFQAPRPSVCRQILKGTVMVTALQQGCCPWRCRALGAVDQRLTLFLSKSTVPLVASMYPQEYFIMAAHISALLLPLLREGRTGNT